MHNHAKILAFIRQQKLAVIATASQTARPESALIAYTEDDDLCLYFQTGIDTRKAANLKINPRVALTIGFSLENLVTVQYEGTATRLMEPADLEACKKRFVVKDSPTTAVYFNRPEVIFFKISPTWISYSDYAGMLPEVIELKTFK